MPCYDGRENERVVYKDRIIEVPANQDQLSKLTNSANTAINTCNTLINEKNEVVNKLKEVEAVCCALLNEAKRRDIFEDFVFQSSTNGKINVMKFAKTHMSKDEAKMTDFIKHLSQDEMETLRGVLKR